MRKIQVYSILLVFVLFSLSFHVIAQDESSSPERDSVAVTIYNEGAALIQEIRTFYLTEGENIIDFTDVATGIIPSSVAFVSLNNPDGTQVIEQNYVYDLVGRAALLQRYIDETIQVRTADGTVYQGQLLAGSGDIILRRDDGGVVIISQDDVQDIQFPELPSGLITRPTLRWLIESDIEGEQQIQLTYLTTGLTWLADYNVLLASDNQTMNMTGWVTLSNTSGTSFEDATVKLIAGNVNRGSNIHYDAQVIIPPTAGGFSFSQRNFSEYKLYELDHPVTIANNETKQVEFLSVANIDITTYYVYDSSPISYDLFDGYDGSEYTARRSNISEVYNYLSFSTAEDGGVGADLPAGRIFIYQEDIDGAALLVSENPIGHTPEGEEIKLLLGSVFDLIGQNTRLDYEQIILDETNGVIGYEETIEIRLRNRKDEAVEIRIPERFTRGPDWEIIESNLEYEILTAFLAEFRAVVEPDEEFVLTYTVRYTSE